MNNVFTKEYVDTLTKQAESENANIIINNILMCILGTAWNYRIQGLYILDGKTAGFLQGSNPETGAALVHTPNIITALSGNVGQQVKSVHHIWIMRFRF
jgi:hypothetical protein